MIVEDAPGFQVFITVRHLDPSDAAACGALCCVDRLAGDGNHTIADEMEEVAVKGLHRIDIRDGNGDPDEAVLEIRYRKIRVLPPIGKQKHYPAPILTVIHAEERGTPKNSCFRPVAVMRRGRISNVWLQFGRQSIRRLKSEAENDR